MTGIEWRGGCSAGIVEGRLDGEPTTTMSVTSVSAVGGIVFKLYVYLPCGCLYSLSNVCAFYCVEVRATIALHTASF